MPGDILALRQLAQGLQTRLEHALPPSSEAWQVVIAGASNIGKSTLFNALVGEERALTAASPGTTRDRISATMRLYAQELEVSDTAGVRLAAEGVEGVEARGIAQAVLAVASAQRGVWLVDAACPLWPDAALAARLWLFGGRADKYDAQQRAALVAQAHTRGLTLRGWVSGTTGEGVAALRAALAHERTSYQQQMTTQIAAGERWLAHARHLELLSAAHTALSAAAAHLVAQAPLDLAATELREAVAWLGKILGRDVDAGVIDKIFAQFCIGK